MNLPLSFWDNMAKNYPRYDDLSMQRDVKQVLEWAKSKGVCFDKKTILDIGCGTGTFAIPLALKGAHVTAIDLSDGMLSALKEDANTLHVSSQIKIHKSKWDDFEVTKTYDIVLASMSPAISSELLIDKMMDATHGIGLYVGWGSYKTNAFVDLLMLSHKIPEKTGGGCIKVEQFMKYLESKKIAFEHSYFTTFWSDTYTYDEAFEYALQQLQRKEITPDKTVIDTLIKDFTQDGVVFIETHAEKGMVLFSKLNTLEMYGCCPKNF